MNNKLNSLPATTQTTDTFMMIGGDDDDTGGDDNDDGHEKDTLSQIIIKHNLMEDEHD